MPKLCYNQPYSAHTKPHKTLMPTPFTHLRITEKLAVDPQVPSVLRAMFQDERPAFLLGGIVADQKAFAGADRQVTHFYRYDKPMPDNPWREMFRKHPKLLQAQSDAHRAFMAAYVAHLAVDEYWSRYMLKPHFANGVWGEDLRWRFYVLHMLLVWMDERDEEALNQDTIGQLLQCQPNDWLPFMADGQICSWRDFIADQLQGTSQTVSIFAERIGTTVQDFRAMMDDEAWMQENLWQHITHELLADIEAKYYVFAREQMLMYLAGTFVL
jgi:hypothetical protein